MMQEVLRKSALIEGEPIDEVELKVLDEKKDSRGSFTEIFQQYWNTCISPVQWSFVKSKDRVFRGMHLHKRHDEYFCILQGSCLLGLVDIRPKSKTYRVSSLYRLYAEDLAALTFPAGLLHGWLFLEDSLHVQAVSESYLDYGKDDNYGCHWEDPELNLNWGVPHEEIITSPRANDFPSLSKLIETLGDI